MFILKKEVLKLIDEETDKALQEALSANQIIAINRIFRDAKTPAKKTDDFFDFMRKAPSADNLSDDALADTLKSFGEDLGDETIQSLVRVVKGADAPEPAAPKPRTATDAASDVAGETGAKTAAKASDEAAEEISDKIGKTTEEVTAALRAAVRERNVGKTTEEVTAALRAAVRERGAPLKQDGLDDLAKKLDIKFVPDDPILRGLFGLGLIGAAAAASYGINTAAASGSGPATAGAPSGGGRAGGKQPTSAAGTAAAGAAGGTGDAGWDKYLRGSEYVTPDQAKQVYDAWVAFVDSQGLKEQTGGVDKSFASYKSWWETNYGNKKLGKYGGVSDTIRYLKSLTKKPQGSSTTPAASTPAASGPVELDAQAQKQMDYYNSEKTRLEKMLNDYNDQIASLLSANTDLKRGMPKKSQFANIMPTPDGVEQIETVKPGTGSRRAQFNKNAQTMINLANAANKAKGVLANLEDYKKNIPVMMKKRQAQQAEKNTISESVYSRWQKIIKG